MKRRLKLGVNHPDTLLTLSALADAYDEGEQPDRAVPLAREFLDRIQTSRQAVAGEGAARRFPEPRKSWSNDVKPTNPKAPDDPLRKSPDRKTLP